MRFTAARFSFPIRHRKDISISKGNVWTPECNRADKMTWPVRVNIDRRSRFGGLDSSSRGLSGGKFGVTEARMCAEAWVLLSSPCRTPFGISPTRREAPGFRGFRPWFLLHAANLAWRDPRLIHPQEARPVQIRINPAFHRHPIEAAIVGRLLSAFGELEFLFIEHARRATASDRSSFLRAMYRLRATSACIRAADAFIRPVCDRFQLGNEYYTIKKAVDYCLKLRNQFSHCNWVDDPNVVNSGILFIDLEEAFEDFQDDELHWKPIDRTILTIQEEFFVYTLESLRWLNRELMTRHGILSENNWPKPPVLEPPPLHTRLSQHIPPWLNEDQKALYLERARAAERGDPTPTPKQQALDTARAAKRARRQADRDRDIAKRSDPDPES
jgi:hypothetical protein